jgi:hypothetical protein
MLFLSFILPRYKIEALRINNERTRLQELKNNEMNDKTYKMNSILDSERKRLKDCFVTKVEFEENKLTYREDVRNSFRSNIGFINKQFLLDLDIIEPSTIVRCWGKKQFIYYFICDEMNFVIYKEINQEDIRTAMVRSSCDTNLMKALNYITEDTNNMKDQFEIILK